VILRRGRRRRQLVDELKETRIYRKLKEETLARAVFALCGELALEESVDL